MLGSMTGPTMHPDYISTAAFAKTGALLEYLHPTYGMQVYRYHKNDAAPSLAIGVCTQKENDSSVDCRVAAGAEKKRMLQAGVPQVVVPTLNYFWGLVRGDGVLLSGAAIVAGSLLANISTAGKWDDVGPSDNQAYAARALVGTGGADNLIRCEVCILGS